MNARSTNPTLRHHFVFCLLTVLTTLSAGLSTAHAADNLQQVSTDTFTNSYSEHRTEVEPDTYAYGSTIVSAFQVARWFNAGGADIGFATSTDGGKSWTHGYLPGLTQNYKGGKYYTASDASVVYDVKHHVWLINYLPITTNEGAVDVAVSSSTDGIHWGNPILVDKSGVDDKNWITCDNHATSPHYGNCYVEWDLGFSTGQIQMSVSSDGGKTWSAAKGTADGASGIGGQPVVQPNGTVVVPIEAGVGISAFTSTNGGTSWSSLQSVSSIDYWGEDGGLRSGPLPSAKADGAGKVYVVWGDCRFRSGCTANDIVMSTSTNGKNWSAVTRIPIDPANSTVDHFIPGLGVDRATSGGSAHLAMTYYYYPVSQCNNSCKLEVGYTTSEDGGKTWTAGKNLAGPMELSWIAPSDNGLMVADYLAVDFSKGNAYGVFAVATAPGSLLNEGMYTTNAPLLTLPGEPRFSSQNDIPVATSPYVLKSYNDEDEPPFTPSGPNPPVEDK
ncbi:MAG TPA: sialidase family protein [Terriglobales bacterium]